MSKGARHGLGVLVGLVFTPVIGFALLYGTQKLNRSFTVFALESGDRWVGAGSLVVAAILIGLLAGSRLSPMAALIPGAVLAVNGLLWVSSPRWMLSHTTNKLPDDLERGYAVLSSTGLLLVLGVLLLISGLAPSRWRAAVTRPAGAAPYAPPRFDSGPAGRPFDSGAPQAAGAPPAAAAPPLGSAGPPPFDPNARPYSQGPPQSPPPASPHNPPQAPPPAPGQSESPRRPQPQADEAGEWTRMYGGDDFRGSR